MAEESAKALSQRAFSRYSDKDFAGALADVERAIELDPKNAPALEIRGLIKQDKKDLDGAIADFTAAIALEPRNAQFYGDRAGARMVQEDLDGARADYGRAIELDPKTIDYRFKRAYAYGEDYKSMIREFDGILEIDPKNAGAFSSRGFAKKEARDFRGALADYTRAVELDPEDSFTYSSRGALKVLMGDFKGAIADHNKAIELDPKRARLYLYRAKSYWLAEEFEASLADANRAIALDKRGDGHHFRALVHLATGDAKTAVADLRELFRLRPNSSTHAHCLLWWAQARVEGKAAADKELAVYMETIAARKPEWPTFAGKFLLGKVEENEFLREGEALGRDHPEYLGQTYFYAGIKRIVEGDMSKGQGFLQKCAELREANCVETPLAKAELKRLKEEGK